VLVQVDVRKMMEKLCCDRVVNDSLTETSDGSASSPRPGDHDGGQRNHLLDHDYDSQCPRLYKLIEEKDWDQALYFLTRDNAMIRRSFRVYLVAIPIRLWSRLALG
jgi:hypothetical protein